MADVLAYAEARSGELRKVALEAVTAARKLADEAGGKVHAILFGAPGIVDKVAPLAAHGADVVLAVEHEAFRNYNPEVAAATVAERLGAGYRAAIFPASAEGRDLAPRVAAKTEAPMVTDVVAFEASADTIVVRHPVNTGKVMSTVTIPGSPALMAIRPNTFTPARNERPLQLETISPSGDPAAARVIVKEVIAGSSTKLDLGEAPVIVSGGRGLKSPENFKMLEDLADAFGNAAVGATRAVTDDGWRPHSDQIGQTGRLVSPDLYIAAGISGAIQHLAGMRTARVIVAINRDKEAPIFKVADYGIVGDVFEVIPALTAAVREARKGH